MNDICSYAINCLEHFVVWSQEKLNSLRSWEHPELRNLCSNLCNTVHSLRNLVVGKRSRNLEDVMGDNSCEEVENILYVYIIIYNAYTYKICIQIWDWENTCSCTDNLSKPKFIYTLKEKITCNLN